MSSDGESLNKPGSEDKLVDEASSTSSDEDRPVPWNNYFALAILCAINVLNFMDRYTVAG